jgi:hypothetical protein
MWIVRMWIAAWCDYLIVALACDIVCLDMPGRATTAVIAGPDAHLACTVDHGTAGSPTSDLLDGRAG